MRRATDPFLPPRRTRPARRSTRGRGSPSTGPRARALRQTPRPRPRSALPSRGRGRARRRAVSPRPCIAARGRGRARGGRRCRARVGRGPVRRAARRRPDAAGRGRDGRERATRASERPRVRGPRRHRRRGSLLAREIVSGHRSRDRPRCGTGEPARCAESASRPLSGRRGSAAPRRKSTTARRPLPARATKFRAPSYATIGANGSRGSAGRPRPPGEPPGTGRNGADRASGGTGARKSGTSRKRGTRAPAPGARSPARSPRDREERDRGGRSAGWTTSFGSAEPEPLQVLPFRTVERDRMVRTRSRARDQLEARTGLDARGEHDFLKEVARQEPGAGASQQPAARRDERHREPVDVLIAARRAGEVAALLRESGRVADDDVPGLPRGGACAEVLEHVRADEVLIGSQEAVREPVLPREGERGGRRLDVHRARCAAGERRDRERTRVREEVENSLPAGGRAESRSVVSLVEEEPRLLSPRDVRVETEAVLEKGNEAWLDRRLRSAPGFPAIPLTPGLAHDKARQWKRLPRDRLEVS